MNKKINIGQVLGHVVVWLFILFWALFFDPRPEILKSSFPFQGVEFQLKIVLILMAAFYLNLFVFIPQIQKRWGWPPYLLIITALIMAFIFVSRFVAQYSEIQSIRQPPPQILILIVLLAFSISTVLGIWLDRAKAEQLKKEKEFEAMNTELSLLRAQISPHFMFNMLNTLNSLARQKSDQLEHVIVRLSQLMRYMLSNKPNRKISLEAETDYLNSYLELQTLRFGDDLDIQKEIQIENPAHELESMLLIPFIENAFKHGVGTVLSPEIEIRMTERKGVLELFVRNRFDPAIISHEDSPGIGYYNVKRRLLLLYGNRHELRINTENNWYTVQLRLLL